MAGPEETLKKGIYLEAYIHFRVNVDEPMTQVRATGEPGSTWYSSPPWMKDSG